MTATTNNVSAGALAKRDVVPPYGAFCAGMGSTSKTPASSSKTVATPMTGHRRSGMHARGTRL
eukprot:CAMPEP_0119159252 /NCGR_PEP_ID=MMETSP1310-20130426/53670_1 /TAXON_ID=464262 /ORGANISM="Genus nov. species nov., Strain RCC2339" /LENGTH=62 /DNA_ID=CAMNT_0007151881 /DNA_START=804 /DNA_END=992 /DNA_ORIENTATION=+